MDIKFDFLFYLLEVEIKKRRRVVLRARRRRKLALI